MRTIYFDYNATTPLDQAVREAMRPYQEEIFGNPSSIHHVGRRARSELDDFRDRAARTFGAKPSEVIFTSGGTESNNLAIFGTARLLREKGRHLITSSIEHHAVLHCFDYLEKHEGFSVTRLPVGSDGQVSVDDVARSLRPDTVLVSVMAANNEVGAIQPVAQIGELCRSKEVIFHTDAVQWFGKEPFNNFSQFNADLVSVCAHKFHGPKGAGMLYIRSPLLPHPILFGGGHENERRAGTENLPAIAGLVHAMEKFLREPVFARAKLHPLIEELIRQAESIPGVILRGSRTDRLCNTASFTVEGCDSITLLAGLDIEGVCASAGAACSAGSLEPSHVIRAMGIETALANSFVRFSLGSGSTAEEVQVAGEALRMVVQRIRR